MRGKKRQPVGDARGDQAFNTGPGPLDEQRKFYDDYWVNREDRLNVHEMARLSQIFMAMALIASQYRATDPKICDLGCGVGWLSHDLARIGTVTGVDLSPRGIQKATERWPEVSFEVADLLSWRPDKRFDIVVSSEVIEHIQDKAAFVATVDHILKPGGHLILTTPNARVKRYWDRTGQGAQLIEEWVALSELRGLFAGRFQMRRHATFFFDFAYVGPFRVLSAPKLLTLLERLRLRDFYDAGRAALGLGLYQILVARKAP